MSFASIEELKEFHKSSEELAEQYKEDSLHHSENANTQASQLSAIAALLAVHSCLLAEILVELKDA